MAIGTKNNTTWTTRRTIIFQFTIILICIFLYNWITTNQQQQKQMETEEEAVPVMATSSSSSIKMGGKEIFGVKIERNPSQSKLDLLAVTTWPTWSGSPSKFPWTFTATETMYLLEGKVKVYCDGHGEEFFEIGAGDLVQFPNGMKVTWDVTEAVKKHYHLDK